MTMKHIHVSVFERVPPEQCGITSASVLNLVDTLSVRKINIHSLMVLRHGKAAVSLWWKPYSPELPHQQYSFSKSVVSLAVGLAEAEGLISLDDRIAGFFPRRITAEADPRIYSVTIEHLLTMTSGAVQQNETGVPRYTDWVEWFLNTPLSSFPGDSFVYNSMNTYMLSAILSKITGCGLVDYLMPRLFEPLGIERPEWDKCPVGIECGGWGLYLKTEDMAKICQLCLDDGVWEGRRILPKQWAARAGACSVASDSDSKLSDSIHRTSGYGYQFWRNGDGTSWRADGMFGQYGLIMPEKDMVIVTTGGHASQMELLEALYDVFIPHVDDIPEGTIPGSDYEELCARAAELTLCYPKTIQRPAELEASLAGEYFDFPVNRHSLLPMSVRLVHQAKSLGAASVRFDFAEDQSVLRWWENGTEYTIPFSPDGRFHSCTVDYSGRSYLMVTHGAWLDESTLEIGLRPIHTAHMQRIIFTFEEDDVVCRFDEDPSMEQLLKMVIDFARPVRPIAKRLSRLANVVMLPVRGTKRITSLSPTE